MPEIPNGFYVSLPRFTEGLRQGALISCGCAMCRCNLTIALSIDMAEAIEDPEPAAPLFNLTNALAKFSVDHDLEFEEIDRLFRLAWTKMLQKKAEEDGQAVHFC